MRVATYLVASLLASASCAREGGRAGSDAAASNDLLIVAYDREPDTLNRFSTHILEDVQTCIVEGLVTTDEKMQVVPLLASEVPSIENGDVVLRPDGATNGARLAEMRLARRWLHRDGDKIPADVKAQVAQVAELHAELGMLVSMREELRSLWTRTNVSAEQLVADLQAWCHKAEQSGIVALQEFSRKLRAARA